LSLFDLTKLKQSHFPLCSTAAIATGYIETSILYQKEVNADVPPGKNQILLE
jgi:hypothetical protein